MKILPHLAAVITVVTFALPVQAHVTLTQTEAHVGGPYRAALRVAHGCEGSPTVKLRVRIPEGFIGVKPQAKAGWQIDIVKGDYEKAYRIHGAEVTSGVTELSWTGRLPDGYFDEFVFTGTLSDALQGGQLLAFPVVQECEQGVARWIDAPSADHHDHGHSDMPAPAVKLLPPR